MARDAVARRGVLIRLACEAFGVSQTCYRYERKRNAQNDQIADWLLRLTDNHRNWGFGLCFLYLRNVKGFGWNHKRIYRIYRDTRFSDDKTPLKTHVAAHFPSRRFGRSGGAGLYVEITPGCVWMGGGMYMPSGPDLQAIREHVADTYPRIHRIVTSPSFNKTVGPLGGDQLTRVPRGYLKDHPAADYLRYKQFLAGCEYPPQFATSARFYSELLSVFRTITPLVRFLNQPLEARLTPPPLLTDAAPPRDPRRAAGLDQRAAPMW